MDEKQQKILDIAFQIANHPKARYSCYWSIEHHLTVRAVKVVGFFTTKHHMRVHNEVISINGNVVYFNIEDLLPLRDLLLNLQDKQDNEAKDKKIQLRKSKYESKLDKFIKNFKL